MKRRDLFGGVWLAVLAVTWSSVAFGAAADDLQRAIQLYNDRNYVEASSLLQSIDPASLSEQQQALRREYLEQVQQPARMQVKAGQDLVDAQTALEAGHLDQAQRLLASVQENEYATAEQKELAARSLAAVAEKQNLAQQADVAEVAAPVTAPAMAPSAATGQGVDARLVAQREAVQLVEQARELTLAGDYDAAEAKLRQALAIAPNLPEAREQMQRVSEARLALPASELVGRIRQTNRLQWDLAVRKYRDLEQQILQAVNAHNFAEATRLLLQARQVIAAARPYAETPEIYQALVADTQSLDRFINEEEQLYNEQQVAAQYERATRQEMERRRLAEETKARQIRELMDEAQRLYRERRFEDAVATLNQILAVDPDNELARWLRTDWEELAIHKREKEMISDMQRERQLVLIEADESMIPWHVYVRYPENWPEISRRQERYGAFQRTESEATRRARAQLNEVVPEMPFTEGMTLRDAIEAVRTGTDLNIVVNWNALAAFGITPDTEVNLPRLTNISRAKGLDLLLAQASAALGGITALDWVIDDGVLTISTTDELSRDLSLRVYDIGDLLVPRQVVQRGQGLTTGGFGGGGGVGGVGGGFGGGGFGGGGGGFGGGGGIGGGTSGATTGGEAEARSITDLVEDIQELIVESVQPTSWVAAGGQASVRVWNDRVLIVTQTPRGHEELRQMLTQLREILGIQVAVEARFLTVSRNYLREIGVDLDVVLNNGSAGFDRAFTGSAAAPVPVLDPWTGAPVLMPRTFGRRGVLPQPVPAPPGVPTAGTVVPIQPYGFVGGVPQQGSLGPHSSQFTAIPISNNTLNLATPAGVTTNVPGSFAGEGFAPGFNIRGSFLDNLQLDFLLRATEADRRSTILTAPRVVLKNTQEASVIVQTLTAFVANVTPVVAEGVATGGAVIGTIPTGSYLWVQAAVSSDLKYVTLTLEPQTVRLVDLVTSTPVTGQAAGGGGIGGGGGGGVSTFQIQLPIQEVTQVYTQVSVPDGGTLLLGGQKLVGEVEIEAGVPILSHIPVLKRAFTNRTTVKDEQTLLILITPNILVEPEEEDKAFPALEQAAF